MRAVSTHWIGWVAALVVLGAALRIAAAVQTFPVSIQGDEVYYVGTAQNIARGEGHRFEGFGRAHWPPGHAYLLSRFIDADTIAGDPRVALAHALRRPPQPKGPHLALLRPLIALQVALGTLLVALTAWLARALFDRRSAVLAALLAALYPTLIAQSHFLWSGLLFSVLLVAALIGVVEVQRRRRWIPTLLAGITFGLAGLTREVGVLVAGASAGWWVWTAAPVGRRRALAQAAVMLGVALLVILPWTWRNYVQLERLVPVSSVGWMGLREGNTLSKQHWFLVDSKRIQAFRSRYVQMDEIEQIDQTRREAFELIGSEQPAWILRKLSITLRQVFGADSTLLYKLRRGAYGEVPDAAMRVLRNASLFFYALVVVAAVLGVAAAPGSGRRSFAVAICVALVAVHVAANATSRYRLPLLPIMIVYASYALVGLRGLRAFAAGGSRVAVLVALAVFFGLCLPRSDPQSWFGRGGGGSMAAAAGGAHATRPGRIILLSMDTVRADRVSGYGPSGRTPAMAKIASEGIVFRDFYAASSYTIPSHMSIFTGLDTAEHGVTRPFARLAPGVQTLAGLLRAAGYRTQAFHEGVFVAARFGFDRGFDAYEQRPYAEVVRRSLPSVLSWIREHREQPYFLFLHSYAAHFPYGGFDRYRREHPERGLPSDLELAALRDRYPGTAPTGSRKSRDVPPETRELCTLYNQLAPSRDAMLACGGWNLLPHFEDSPHRDADLAATVTSYEERIRLIDRAVKRIRATLESIDQWNDTLFVITSDHGEAFFEHGTVRHDFVPFDEVMKVPLLISFPRGIGDRGGRVVEGLAWHLDLMPTILGLADVEPPARLRGLDLSAVIRDDAPIPSNRAIFPAVLRPAHGKQEPLKRVVLQRAYKWIEGHPGFGDPEGLLFDRIEDPGERHNLRESQPARGAELAALAEAWEGALEPSAPVHQQTRRPLVEPGADAALRFELDAAEKQQLNALGYLEEIAD